MTPASPHQFAARPRARIAALFVVVSLVGLGAAVSATYSHARAHDFLGFYAAARLARNGEYGTIHEPAGLAVRQRQLLPEADLVIPFNRPPAYAVVLAPLTLLPYDLAFGCWLALGAVGLLGCWVWAARQFGYEAVVFGALYPPAILGIAHGQDCVFMLALAIGAYALARRRNDLLSGAVLGLGLVKFHLFLLWPFALLLRRKWKMLGGFSASGALLGLGSLATVGWTGLHRYVAMLGRRDLEALSPSPYKQISVWGLLANGNVTSAGWGAVLAVALGLFILYRIRGCSVERLFAAAISGSLLIAPHVYGYDAAILLLPLWLTMFHGGGLAKQGARLLALPPIWAFLAFGPPLAGVTAACVLGYAVLAASPGKLAVMESGSPRHSDGLKPTAVRMMPS